MLMYLNTPRDLNVCSEKRIPHFFKTMIYFLVFWLLSVVRGHSFFHPCHKGQWPLTSKDFYTRSYPSHFCPILNLEKEPVFSFLMLSAKQGNYWYHFDNIFGMKRFLTGDWTWDLQYAKPALYHDYDITFCLTYTLDQTFQISDAQFRLQCDI